MAQYTPTTPVSGTWVKTAELEQGTKAKLTAEPTYITRDFAGQAPKQQLVGKVKFQGKADEFNVGLNRATADGLYSAFGGNMDEWVGRLLTVQTEKAMVAGKRVTILYLIPEDYTLSEDSGGYAVIVPKDKAMAPKQPVVNVDEDEDITAEIPF